jgi:hypothetical protein
MKQYTTSLYDNIHAINGMYMGYIVIYKQDMEQYALSKIFI